MPRLLVPLVLVAVAATTASTATAAVKPKPVKMTHYLHGTQSLGEAEQFFGVGGAMRMDKVKPTGTQARSKQVTNYVAGPNPECTGNPFFAYWDGVVNGTLSGKATVRLFTTAAPGSEVLVRLFNAPKGECNEGYEVPIAEKAAAVPQGDGTVVVVMDVKRRAKPIKGILRLMVSTVGDLGDASQTRLRYDAVSAPAAVTFTCLPKPGKKTC